MKRLLLCCLLLLITLNSVGCANSTKYSETVSSYESTTNVIFTEENKNIVVDTKYYTIEIPNSWGEDCFYEIDYGENQDYAIAFYDKANYEEYGGFLFSIVLSTEEYSSWPSCENLGVLDVGIESYYMFVVYPTDVQHSDESIKKYQQLSSEIPEILNTISFKNGCVISKETVPDTSEILQESKTTDFYAELCYYVVVSCVNYTEWWKNPTLSYTDPTYYYLGKITAENYSEKMEKAKHLVDGIYKIGYWEIVYRGYGTIKMGLYITPDDELYFCYRY